MKVLISASARQADTVQSLTAQKKDLEKQLLAVEVKLNNLNAAALIALLPAKGYYQISRKSVAADGPVKITKMLVQVKSAKTDSVSIVLPNGRQSAMSVREWAASKAKPITKQDFEAAAPKVMAAPKIKVSAAARAATSKYEFTRKIGEFLSKKRFKKIEQAIQEASTSSRATVVSILNGKSATVGTWTSSEGFKWASEALRKKFTGT